MYRSKHDAGAHLKKHNALTPKFTLVSTVYNEANRLNFSIADIEAQSYPPDEIVITDAGSKDGTWEILNEWRNRSVIRIVLISDPGCNVARGRNLAIAAATHDLIASTDFGCRFEKDWLKNLMTPFSMPEVKIVGGAYGVLEDDQKTNAAKAAYVLADGYATDVNSSWFLPSSRSIAYYKSIFTHIGGYDESLTLAGDDTLFAKKILQGGYNIHRSEHVGVYWGRHESAVAYGKEAYRYGLGDGEARINFRTFASKLIEMGCRYIFLIAAPVLLILLASDVIAISTLLILVPLLFGFRSYLRLFRRWLKRSPRYGANILLSGLFLVERTSWKYAQGYINGLQKQRRK